MTKSQRGEMVVSAIQNGTVIDRISPQHLFQVMSILKLSEIRAQWTLGNYLDSKRLGKKAVLKIADTYLDDAQINNIALISPDAVINIIKDYEVVQKYKVEIPDEVIGSVRCLNPKCITNHEPMLPRYKVLQKNPVALRCEYCEWQIQQSQINII